MFTVAAIERNFEIEKNKKAFVYTLIVCATLLLLFFIIRWSILPVSPPPPAELFEINLGNNEEGFGEEQPLKKGEMGPAKEPSPAPQKAAVAQNIPSQDLQPDDNAEADAAPVAKPEKKVNKPVETPKENVTKPVKTNTPAPVATPAPPKPQKPKATYPGTQSGTGNNADQDNGFQNQGNNKGGRGDAGDPSGKPDSYGNTPGGRSGGPRVTSGNRKIVRYYSFTGDLEKATVYAIIKVSPSGIGTFAGFGKGSTKTSSQYANSIRDYLRNIQFDKASEESTVTVQFNFNVQ